MYVKKDSKVNDVFIYKVKMRDTGLTKEEIEGRLRTYGENVLNEKRRKSALSIFLSQFNDFMIWVLVAATIVSWIMGEKADAVTIAAIVIVNGIMGFIQEYRTEKSMDALKELTAPTARVMREGRVLMINAKEIVPDDLILLEAGDRVPADCILIESISIQADESLLTGESVPVEKKSTNSKDRSSLIGSRENTLFMGTTVIGGRGRAVAVATGMATEMGNIADMLQNAQDEQTPLQKRLDRLGKILVFGCLAICLVVTATGILKGENIYTMFLIGVSLAVAAIPEGLPAIVTVSLALGVQRMLKRNALIRKLPAVETLGCTNIICSDKTGTLTENKMTIKKIYYDSSTIDVSGSGYDIAGEFYKSGRKVNVKHDALLSLVIDASVSCTDSEVRLENNRRGLFNFKSNSDSVSVTGDPTEIALLICGCKAGIYKEDVNVTYTRVNELPFDSNRKRMSVVVKGKDGYYVFVKGAIDSTIDLCSYAAFGSENRKMTPVLKNTIMSVNDNMARQALRVLAIAYRKLPSLPDKVDIKTIEKDLTFLGLMGMIDPPRPEAIKAIDICKTAGIKPVMITGDHKETAIAIAKELKLFDKDSNCLTGKELDQIDDRTLDKVVRNTSVFARVTPKHKLKIVKAYKNNGYIVAMTGDGVNDAPAVKEADIGVSMGKSGTDVTKEASAMVLLDDNFATIVAAVEEGRSIYDNIRKFIRYLLSCNLGEVLTMFLSSLIGYSTPLLPIQILWVNLVTDGLPALALGVDTADKDIMIRRPRGKHEGIFSGGLSTKIIIRGALIGICTLAVFLLNLKVTGSTLEKARTMAFATLVISQLIHVFECRSERHSIFEINFFGNLYLIGAVLISISMLCIAIYTPVLQPVFKTAGLTWGDWVEVLFFSSIAAVIVNLQAYMRRG